MTAAAFQPLVAVDIGNTRLKLGLFESLAAGPHGLPEPSRTCFVSPASLPAIEPWLAPYDVAGVSWWIGSVQRCFTGELLGWLRDGGRQPRIVLLCSADLPLRVELPRPDMVGIDRLLSAVAANRLRPPDHEMVVVDLGTAVTVDLLSAGGAFQGGAICPGIGTSARALHEFTDLLPQLDMTELHTPPPACGRDTQGAMRSGLFWGAVGGVRELVARLSTPGKPHTVVMTGGAAPNVAALVAPDALFVPHLTLSGIALAAAQPA